MQISRIRLIFPLFVCLTLLVASDARRVRIRPRPVTQRPQLPQETEDLPESELNSEEDSRAQSAIQYYDTEPRDNLQDDRVVLISSSDDYNGLYGQPTVRARADHARPTAQSFRSTTIGPRTKEQGTKSPPVQTIRNYSKVNDDGSFTFGYEAADGSFKEETRGTDCVVRGKYGYVDPDGNKREFTYVSGNPCDPNNPEGHESGEERDRESSIEESNEPENIPPNYPKQRPQRPLRPIPTTTHAPTTFFQNNYAQQALGEGSEEEQPEPIQVLQPQKPRLVTTTNPPLGVQPLQLQSKLPSEISIRQRQRIAVQTTPSPVSLYSQSPQPVSITPRPQVYRASSPSYTTQPPATTYRPTLKLTQQPASISYKSTPRPSYYSTPIQNTIPSTTRHPIDFAEELQKFQKEHNILTTTTHRTTTPPLRQYKVPVQQVPVTSNPIYESQLIFDPSSGQYDSALYQQLPQTDGDFSLSHRIQPYVHQQISSPAPQPQLLNLEQIQQASPLYTRTQPTALPQFSQQIYENEREQIQVLSSQQLFQQQQELQKQQLQRDRLDAARKAQQHQQQMQQQHQQQQHQHHQQQQLQQQQHRFQPSQQIQRPTAPDASSGFYYLQPSSSGGQIEAFLRGHNIDF